ncbi:acyl-CoA dehydrogenase family protein [Leucobacter sp. M11]|uniref:acyl-CoA dehydrogenase family protein n=1 Tax=Leucobacter sp. M11 TaxID=2993565 RepID=UPI002D7F174A|nr:acyl-CoA dehydrogenase family protein [Leucobacter sp. M11]MEB4615462.1 acyl-CoA dehydrogenase family protein [Leucobacter sp. M11]
MTDYALDTPLDTDYYGVFADVPAADREVWMRARAMVEQTMPEVNAAWDAAEYPLSWARRMGEMDLLNDGVAGPGLNQVSPLAAGLAMMELHRGDGSIGTIAAVQAGLALRSIADYGSEAQRERWLGPLSRGEELGAFALTEPEHGSDSVGLETSVRVEGDELVLNGEKKWIGNGSVGHITVVFARDEEGKVRGVLVPQDTPGYSATTITGKVALRAIHQAEITLTDVRVPADSFLPGIASFKDVSKILFATRLGVAWSALGHATAVFESALSYAKQRIQFGKPLASFQMVQERLTEMLSDLVSLQLHCRQLADLDAAGEMRPTQASLAKYTATRTARRMASTARDMLGGNGILLENHVVRHFADIEALHTYEGTESVQALLVGRDLTGIGAFS